MVPPLRSHILPFAFLFLPLVPLYAKLPLDEERHLNCSTPENCAGFHITYPFFLRDDREEDYCGHPGYGLECDDEKILTLMIHDDKYQVLNITKENQSLIVARMDILNDGCPEQSNDFTLDHRFNFTDNDLEATLLLDCSPEDHPPPQLREYFICSPSDGSLTNRLTLGPDENSWKPHCSASLKIRMLRSAAQNLTDNKINSFQALQKGFEVSWGTQINATECLACMNSGGACGYNASLSTFSCYCVDGAHQGTCSGPLLSSVICPMDLSYVLTIPWNNSSCRNDATLSSFPPPLNDSCCNTLLSLYGIAFAQHLNDTNFFELPDLDTSASCLQSFQSKLDSLNLPTNITSYCFSPSQFVIPENSCASIKSSNDLVRQLESTQELTELNSSCRSDLTDPFNCVSCRQSANFARDKLLHEMEDDSVSNSTAAECYYFTILYAAGIINLMGPASRGVLTCIFTLPLNTGGKSRWKVKLGIALLSTLVFAVVASVLIVIRCCNLRSCSSQIDENSFDVENFTNGIIVRKYPYSELKRITNSFSIKLGEGGYGSVYKGSLKDGRPVAVKILNVSKESCGEDFFNEVASISRTAHVNVVALLGFCYERKRRALVYEFMPNGSLDKFITTKENSKRSSTLECKVLYKITLGIARGLEYLHRGCNTRIVHFDIKPHNILLDQDFVPKISDFGLAKLWQGKESMVSMLGTRGTIGYIAPEVFCRNFGGVSHKSDVYSYGMLVLDMVCGRYNSDARVSHTSDAYFPDWIYKEYLLLGKEITLSEITTEEEEEITRKMIIVSLWCIQNRSSDRPCIKEVIEMLEGSLQSLQLPILKPFQASPERLPEFNFPSSSQSLYSS